MRHKPQPCYICNVELAMDMAKTETVVNTAAVRSIDVLFNVCSLKVHK